jgi:hypothetical protein
MDPSTGIVPLSLLLGFNRMRQLASYLPPSPQQGETVDVEAVVREALLGSEVVVVVVVEGGGSGGERAGVRRKDGWEVWVLGRMAGPAAASVSTTSATTLLNSVGKGSEAVESVETTQSGTGEADAKPGFWKGPGASEGVVGAAGPVTDGKVVGVEGGSVGTSSSASGVGVGVSVGAQEEKKVNGDVQEEGWVDVKKGKRHRLTSGEGAKNGHGGEDSGAVGGMVGVVVPKTDKAGGAVVKERLTVLGALQQQQQQSSHKGASVQDEDIFRFDDEGDWTPLNHRRHGAGGKKTPSSVSKDVFELELDAEDRPSSVALRRGSVSSVASSFDGYSVDDWNDMEDEDLAGLMIVTQKTFIHDSASVSSTHHGSIVPKSPMLKAQLQQQQQSQMHLNRPHHQPPTQQHHHNLPPRKHGTIAYDRSARNAEINEIINEGLYFYQKDLKKSARGGPSSDFSLSSSFASGSATPCSSFVSKSSVPSATPPAVSLLTRSMSSSNSVTVADAPASNTTSSSSVSLDASAVNNKMDGLGISLSAASNSIPCPSPMNPPPPPRSTPRPSRPPPRHFWDSTSAASPPVGWLINQMEPPTPPFGPMTSPLLSSHSASSRASMNGAPHIHYSATSTSTSTDGRPPLPPSALPLPSTSPRFLDIPDGAHSQGSRVYGRSLGKQHVAGSMSPKFMGDGGHGKSYKEFHSFQHPSYELLKDNGFIQHKYHKYHAKALNGNFFFSF